MVVLAWYCLKACLVLIGFLGHDSSSFIVGSFQMLVYGLIFGYLTAHTAPALWDKYVDKSPIAKNPFNNGCRFGFWSWDVMTNPQFAFWSEWEMVKDHVLFWIVTFQKTNCLTYLYTGSDRSFWYIFERTKNRLIEIQGGAVCR